MLLRCLGGHFSLKWGQLWATVVFSFVAILFNPFIPIDLSRSIWRPIDIGAAALFLLAIPLVKVPGTSEGKWRLLTLEVPLMVALVAGYGIGWLYIYGPHKAQGALTNRLMDCIEAGSQVLQADLVATIESAPITAAYVSSRSEWVVSGPGAKEILPVGYKPDPAGGIGGIRGIMERARELRRRDSLMRDPHPTELASAITGTSGRWRVYDDLWGAWLAESLSWSWLAEPLSRHWLAKPLDENAKRLLRVTCP